jgi:hypothetical protein
MQSVLTEYWAVAIILNMQTNAQCCVLRCTDTCSTAVAASAAGADAAEHETRWKSSCASYPAILLLSVLLLSLLTEPSTTAAAASE